MSRKRLGFSFIEILIVIAILVVLFGLLLGVIQKVRTAASGLEDKNKLKQIILAMHQVASQDDGKLPAANGVTMDGTEKSSPHWAVMPYLASGSFPYYRIVNHAPYWDDIGAFYSKLDESHKWQFASDYFSGGKISFPYSAPAFSNQATLPSSFTDGTSHTVGFAEHYNITINRFNHLGFAVSVDLNNENPSRSGPRTSSFCDPGFKDWMPTIIDGKVVSYPKQHPIQLAPRFDESDGSRLQAMQSSGLKTAMMDGSVRILSPSIRPELFWAFITPNGGEILGE
jgi:prepilin-type N-terminal cleavage/methylation domain-containing protein